MGIGNPIIPRTRAELERRANPEQAQEGESIPHLVYDTELYTSAVTRELNFFAAVKADPTLSNMDAGGQFPEPQFFEPYNLGFDVIADMSLGAGVATGVLDDIQKLLLIGRPVFTLIVSNKNYGPYPLSALHTSGGVQGMIAATLTAPADLQIGNNSFPDGGWNWFGGVIIPPMVGWRVNVRWESPQTLAAGNPQLRFWMSGTLHRRVL